MTPIRLAHVAMHAELEQVICSGPRRAREFTYALLAERAPHAVALPRDEALGTLATRFFGSHGPATVRDFAWWSGLPAADAKRAIDIIKARRVDVSGRAYWTAGPAPRGTTREPRVHLLPVFDEYLVAYRDRLAVPHGLPPVASGPRFASLEHWIVIAGQVAGTWHRVTRTREIHVDVTPCRKLTRGERAAISEAFRRYETFVGMSVACSIG